RALQMQRIPNPLSAQTAAWLTASRGRAYGLRTGTVIVAAREVQPQLRFRLAGPDRVVDEALKVRLRLEPVGQPGLLGVVRGIDEDPWGRLELEVDHERRRAHDA